jgi:surface polysaccharide O-acyltransferase-like enzyme
VAEKKRRANYELLRVLAMLMVVVMHFLARSDSLLETDTSVSFVRLTGSFLEAFCLVAVNVYVLLSGYFGVKSPFKPSKAVGLLCQIWFYALLIPLVLGLLGLPTSASTLGVYGLIQYLFPIETEHYWFATSYFMLYLLSPVLSVAVKHMSRKQLQITLGGLLILFSVIKSFSPFVFAFDRYGYDLPWFICVYLTAAYLSLYGLPAFEKRGWLLYVGSCLAGFGVNLSMCLLAKRWDSFSYYATVPFHYNYILCLAGAVGLFYGFSKIRIKEGKTADLIRRLGSLSFGVYLLHEHIDLRQQWYGWLCQLLNPGKNQGMLAFLWELCGCTLILFVAGILVEWLRSGLFGILRGRGRLGLLLKKLDETFVE